jgi:hypothetical protein
MAQSLKRTVGSVHRTFSRTTFRRRRVPTVTTMTKQDVLDTQPTWFSQLRRSR